MKFGVALFCAFFAQFCWAQSHSAQGDALWMLQRLTGIKWSASSNVVQQMANKISQGDTAGAASLAMQQPQFLDVTVKNMALKMSTREESVGVPFNDFAADFIGVTRDDVDARQLLTGNFYYAADMSKVPSSVPAYSYRNDGHYAALESANVDYGAVLKRFSGQTVEDGKGHAIANPDAAGVLTSYTFLTAHALGGTNRRLVQYAFREFMCTPIQDWADTSAPDSRIGRDVNRFPGNDYHTYETSCKGCHSGMDGFRGAFAHWDSIETRVDNPNVNDYEYVPVHETAVAAKMNQNADVYPDGYVTKDDSWVNNATRPANAARFGWRGNTSGNGVNSFGTLIANSEKFSQCMAQHVFEAVCQYDLPQDQARALYNSLGLQFEKNSYDLKKLFQSVVLNSKCRLQ